MEIKKFSKGLAKRILRLFFSMLLILMVAMIPSIYEYEQDENWRYTLKVTPSNYFDNIKLYLNNLADGDLGKYGKLYSFGHNPDPKQRDISSDILIHFKITATIFISGLLLGIISGITAAFVTLLMKQKWRRITHLFSFFLIALPDFFIIVTLQLLIIAIYKKTGIRLFAIATGGNSTAVFLPILTLSIFPFVYMYRATLNNFEETLTNQYILTAYAKGLVKLKILFSHVAKNGLITSLNNLPSIILPTVSNLIIIEYLFNTRGLTYLVFQYYNSASLLVISVFLIWLMVESILLINDLILKSLIKHRGDSHA